MEGEHGDLGLGSKHPSLEEPQIPLSKLGKQLRSPENQDLKETLEDIWQLADGNIGMARKRMELMHEQGKVHKSSDGLPDVVISMFNAVVGGMTRGLTADTAQKHLGIRAIVALALFSRRSRSMGLSPSDFAGIEFERLASALLPGSPAETHAVHTILQAARGLLVLNKGKPGFPISYYNAAFEAYVIDRYNLVLGDIEQNMARDPAMLKILQGWENDNQSLVDGSTDTEDEDSVMEVDTTKDSPDEKEK